MAALNPLYSFDQIPTTSEAAIREFNDRYLAAIGASVPSGWADMLGELVPTDRPMITFPVSQLRTLFKRTEGESKFKTLGEASFDVKSEEFDDGYQAKVKDLFNHLFAYRNWQQAPQRLVLAEEQLRHTSVAALLTAGTTTKCVDGSNFFATNHPANITDSTVTGTYSNYNSTATNVLGSAATANTGGTHGIDNIQNEVTSMQTQVLDENGLLLGVDPDTIAVPYDYYEPLKNMLARERVLEFVTNVGLSSNNPIGAAATDNFYKGRFNVVPIREFSIASGTTADWYLIDSKMIKKGVSPWVIMRETVPQSLALRVFDESSDFFRNTGSIKMSAHVWYGFALALPHAIRRIKGPTR